VGEGDAPLSILQYMSEYELRVKFGARFTYPSPMLRFE
jgi:hypothetical protein